MTNKKSPIKHFLEVTLQGVFWLLPIVAVVMIVLWLYNKVDLLAHSVFTLIGFAPQNNGFLWLLIVVVIFVFLLYIVGHLMETRVATFLETVISKIPGYSTIKDIIGIFN